MIMSATMRTEFDLLIVGGGLTGAALALALSSGSSSLRIALVDAVTMIDQTPSFDERVLALSEGSRRLLEQLGVWSMLAQDACPIQHIHVSDRGQFGRTVLNAAEHHVAALGQVLPLRVIGQCLYRELEKRASVTRLAGKVNAFSQHADGVSVELNQNGKLISLTAQVLLAADGGPSSVRALAGLPVDVIDYQQSAVIATVRAERAHRYWAYERFTQTGPLALLPMTEQRLSLVWTQTPIDASRLLQISEGEFLHELQQAFGWRLGQLRQIGVREKFDLKRVHSPIRRQGRLLLMGNAANTLHPIAGQGFNLALRDAMAFAVVVQRAQQQAAEWSAPTLLDAFVQQRQTDANHVTTATDGLVRLFSNQHPVLAPMRGVALSVLDLLPPLKQAVATRAMGLG